MTPGLVFLFFLVFGVFLVLAPDRKSDSRIGFWVFGVFLFFLVSALDRKSDPRIGFFVFGVFFGFFGFGP